MTEKKNSKQTNENKLPSIIVSVKMIQFYDNLQLNCNLYITL